MDDKKKEASYKEVQVDPSNPDKKFRINTILDPK
jgi:hypothetical protein